MSMLKVIEAFENYMYDGNPIPFEIEITISEKYLKNQEKGKSF